MSSRPRSHRSYGGIDWVASSWISDVRASMSYASNAATYRASSSASAPSTDGDVSAALTSLVSSVARARCSALLTDATLVSSSSATSDAFQRRTSQRIRTARCRGGRCWSAATNARRIVSRATATSAGSPSGTTRPSGIGSIHVTSGSVFRFSTTGSRAALAAAHHVEADVRRDAVEPRSERGAPLEAVVAAPRADQRLLHRVLGLERRAEHAVAVADELAPVPVEAALEVVGAGPDGERRVLHDPASYA